MAKSIHTTVKEDRIEVNHSGETYYFDTPEWLMEFGQSGVMESEEQLLEIAQRQGILHGLLHGGIKQAIIDIRAKARPSDIKGETQPMDEEAAQGRIDTYKPKPVPVPGRAKPVDPKAALAALKESGMSKEELLTALGLV